MDHILDFFSHPFFSVVGGLTTLLAVAGVLVAIACWLFDVTPIAIRFGQAIRSRTAAVFASADGYATISESLCRSRIFKRNNLNRIQPDNLLAGADHTLFVVDWSSFSEHIDSILALRRSVSTPVVILAAPGSIEKDRMNQIANLPCTIVVNFRGRLLNDIVTLLVTTSYDRK